MMKYSRIWIFMLVLTGAFRSAAQDTLTVQQAIAHALSKNYDVLVQQNNAEKSENLAHPGQAGLLPTIALNGNAGAGIQNTKIEIAGQADDIVNTGAKLINYSAAVSLNYTVFTGFANKYRFDQLKINADMADISTRMLIENTMLQVVSAYYNALRAQQNTAALKQSLALSKQNWQLARERQLLSGGSALNTLNSEVNFQRDSINYLNAVSIENEAMIALNLVMGESDIAQAHNLSRDEQVLGVFNDVIELEKTATEDNSEMRSIRQSMQLSMLDLRLAKASYSPVLSLQSSYSVSVTENEGSFLLLNQASGLNGGLTLSIPIFAGNTRARNKQNAELSVYSSKIREEQAISKIRAALYVAWDAYQTSKLSVQMEKKALGTAVRNLELSESQYRTGSINSTQLREAQVNLTLARNSLNNSIYNLRLAEMELLRLSGQLLE